MALGGTGLYMGPYFRDPQPLNFTVHKNSAAYLPCEVRQLGDKKVSWVRAKKEDSDILTVGQYTFVNDERFSVFKSDDTWTLVIKYVQARDSGVYECQISTEPKMALRFRLNVIVPQVEITGEAEKYVRKGSTAKLECRVSSTVELPDYIFWYRAGQRLLEYDEPRMSISVSRASGDKDKSGEMSVTSVLVIFRAHLEDAGNYTCLPSNLPNSTIRLHVLDGEHPAAMQTGSASVLPLQPSSLLLATILVMTLSAGCTCDSSLGRRVGVVQAHQPRKSNSILTRMCLRVQSLGRTFWLSKIYKKFVSEKVRPSYKVAYDFSEMSSPLTGIIATMPQIQGEQELNFSNSLNKNISQNEGVVVLASASSTERCNCDNL
ncbi:zwei Ig domain protein zig-8 [Hyalella azteca]|uniref:Zwei Ig domain protein zig-8 n=1 Tax=Hyalella azteca TaxID=294128 RepID=A0A8B7NV08_HYAAZ|nr:zwei Ig domain protein zig-8 [Hyalella azteca]